MQPSKPGILESYSETAIVWRAVASTFCDVFAETGCNLLYLLSPCGPETDCLQFREKGTRLPPGVYRFHAYNSREEDHQR